MSSLTLEQKKEKIMSIYQYFFRFSIDRVNFFI